MSDSVSRSHHFRWLRYKWSSPCYAHPPGSPGNRNHHDWCHVTLGHSMELLTRGWTNMQLCCEDVWTVHGMTASEECGKHIPQSMMIFSFKVGLPTCLNASGYGMSTLSWRAYVGSDWFMPYGYRWWWYNRNFELIEPLQTNCIRIIWESGFMY